MTFTDTFSPAEIRAISEKVIEKSQINFDDEEIRLPRRMQRFLYDEGLKAREFIYTARKNYSTQFVT